MDVISVARRIQECVDRLQGSEAAMKDAARARAVAIAEYDRDLGVCVAKLNLGEVVMVEDKAIQNPTATTTKELAKGAVWKSRFALEKADAHYKVVMAKIDSIKAMLIGLQSIYKRLDNV